MPHYRFATFSLAIAVLLWGGLWATPAIAQTATGKAPLLLQRIDDTLYGVDMLSLAVVDRHHVSGILVRVNAARPHPPLDYSHFVVDCQGAMRMAQIASAVSPFDLTLTGASARARLQAATQFIRAAETAADTAPAAEPAVVAGAATGASTAAPPGQPQFKPLATLNGSRALAEFTCAAMRRPAQAAPLAKDVFDNGGPRDLRTALCDLQPDGASVTREDVAVRFSDSEKVVSVNNQWMSTGTVTDTEISFGSGPARWRIDRNSAEASLVTAAGKVVFMGSCVAASKP